MSQRVRTTVLIILFLASAASLASAGVVIEQEVKGEQPGQAVRQVLYVEAGRLRVESQTSEGPTILIFRADRQVVWVIQPATNSYHEMTPAGMDEAAAKMEAALKEVPPEQRAMVEQMMKQRMGGAKPSEVSVKRVGAESLGKFTTTKYEVWSNGQRTSEVWAAPLAQLNLQPAEYETFKQFASFMEKLIARMPGGAGAQRMFAPQAASIEGFPVKVVSYDGGNPVGEQQVIRAERQSVADDKFQLPAGARKMQMEGPQP